MAAVSYPQVRIRYTFRGIIQGVGFRPAVYRCASALGLAGFVRNQRSEVVAEVEGPAPAVRGFPDRLREMLPAAARVDRTEEEPLPVAGERSFRIVESLATEYSFPPIPPDLAICPDCRRELFDPRDRRYLYPFITCTQCGPRYSIVEDTPFDRHTTSMVDFPQCPECLREYQDPLDRRFHSQTNSCPRCGPTLRALRPDGAELPGDPLRAAVEALAAGGVVAVQGVGGFHLAADPSRAGAVQRLRREKARRRKPFALMVRDMEEADGLCLLSPAQKQALAVPASPIVIAPIRSRAPGHLSGVSAAGTLGVMLPYTPLHLLLFQLPGLAVPYAHLIMTSGNRKDEPIATSPDEALQRLGDCADLFLCHDRRILFRTDDSVLRHTSRGAPVFLRRSRGYVPGLITLHQELPAVVLAAGGDLKSAPALGKGRDVTLSPYLGDLEDALTLRDFQRQIETALRLYAVEPQVLAHDLHPGYHSTRWALEQPAPRRVGVQHHHAHVLSVMAEHGLEESLGLAFDGTGYGTDGTVWGGEFLHATRRGFARLGCFRPFLLPGGEAAVLHPLRIALSLLQDLLDEPALERLFLRTLGMEALELETVRQMVQRRINSALTSSLGRLLDAASALLGLVREVTYEGEGPILLEGAAARHLLDGGRVPELSALEPPPVEPARGEQPFALDLRPLLLHLAAVAGRPQEVSAAALRVHAAVARAALEGALLLRRSTGLSRIALSGGVFQNTLLLDLLLPALRDEGFEAYTHFALPPGDGGLAVGQVYFQGDFG